MTGAELKEAVKNLPSWSDHRDIWIETEDGRMRPVGSCIVDSMSGAVVLMLDGVRCSEELPFRR